MRLGLPSLCLKREFRQKEARGSQEETLYGDRPGIGVSQNRRDLPRDIPLDSVVVLRYEKRSKSENKGKVSTEMELVLEQTQQGTSYEVSVSTEGVEELKRKVKIKGEKKEALLTLRQKPEQYEFDESNAYVLERFYTSARNPVKEILLKLNLPDHRILKDGGEVDDDNSERSERFAEEVFGSAVVLMLVLCSFTRSVSDFLAGMVETIVRATSSMRSCGGVPAKAIVVVFGCSLHQKQLMVMSCRGLLIHQTGIHHCHKEISEDLRLSREINALCARLTGIVDERERFVDELDRLIGRSVPERMAEFMKQVQGKDMPSRLKLQILSRKFELRAREKDIFIEKLKGNMDF
ncbi:hypothetical protein Tco_1475751 [Tanacetum coccineum]